MYRTRRELVIASVPNCMQANTASFALSASALLLVACSWLVAPIGAQTVLRNGWKVQSSAQIGAPGEKISQPGFSTQGWYRTSAPKTVFAVLVENGVYKNPYYGMNLRSVPGVEYKVGGQFANEEMPANSPFTVPWWYRTEFHAPTSKAAQQYWLDFHGINYRANIWINGAKVAGSDEVVGAFRRYGLRHPAAPVELGAQELHIGEAATFVVPNPSPANAHFTPADQVRRIIPLPVQLVLSNASTKLILLTPLHVSVAEAMPVLAVVGKTVHSKVMFAGQVITGAVVSRTVTVNEQ